MKFSLKNIENWRFWKMTFFWVGHFGFLFSKKNFLFCFFLMEETLGFIWGIIFFEILMITLVSSQKSLPPNISAGSVPGIRRIKPWQTTLERHQGPSNNRYRLLGWLFRRANLLKHLIFPHFRFRCIHFRLEVWNSK